MNFYANFRLLDERMSRVNSFLFCVKLESFGLFLGWFEYGMSIFVAAGSVIGTAFVLKDAVTSESVVRGLNELNDICEWS